VALRVALDQLRAEARVLFEPSDIERELERDHGTGGTTPNTWSDTIRRGARARGTSRG
jgi:hypothetical protein